MKADVQEVIKLGYRKLTLYKQQGLFQNYDLGSGNLLEACGFFDPKRESVDDLVMRFSPVTPSK